MPVLMQISIGLIAVYLLFTAGVFLFQRRLMYNRFTPLRTPHRDKSPNLEKIILRTMDGLELVSYYKPPKMTRDGNFFPTILYMHGNTGTAGDSAHKLIPLAEAGFGILLLEYRGYGKNPGKPTEKGLIRDAEAALHFIHLRQGKGARVVYYGMSMGTGVANGLAEKRPPAALVQECGFTSMTEAAARHFWMFPVRILIKDRFKSLKRIRSLKAPLLVLHGEQDGTVPVIQGRKIFETAGSEDKTIKIYPEGRHINLYDFGASDDVLKWLYEKFPDTAPAA